MAWEGTPYRSAPPGPANQGPASMLLTVIVVLSILVVLAVLVRWYTL
jgi:hypothetical protein